MCRFKSGIIFKGRVVLAPDGNESHSDLLEKLGVEDNTMGAMTRFVRAELLPKDGNKATPIEKWRFINVVQMEQKEATNGILFSAYLFI